MALNFYVLWITPWEHHIPLAFTRTVTHYHLGGTWASISETRPLLNAQVNRVAQKIIKHS
jgi:hypothetical protein